MNTIEVLSPKGLAVLSEEISEVLSSNGFRVINRAFVMGSEASPALSVAIVEPADPNIFFEIGCRIGLGLPVILISKIKKPHTIPNNMKHAQHLLIGDPNLCDNLVKKVKLWLGISQPTSTEFNNLESYLFWLSKDWDRLHHLEPKAFERLIALIFENLGFEVCFRNNRMGEFKVHFPSWNKSWIVNCKVNPTGQPLGIGAVSDVHAVCLAERQNFTYLIANVPFTSAAVDLASRCVPAVHLLDVEIVRRTLSEALQRLAEREFSCAKLLNRNEDENTEKQSVELHNYNMQIDHKSENSCMDEWLIPSLLDRRKSKSESNSTTIRKPFQYDACFVITGGKELAFEIALDRLFKRLKKANKKMAVLRDKYCEVPLINWADEIRTSRDVFILIKGDDIWRQKKILQMITQSIRYDPDIKQKYFVFGQDNEFNRMSLPGCLRKAIFLDPSRNRWIAQIEEQICRTTE